MFMLGVMGESPESDPTPAITRFVNVEPSALLNAPSWLALLTTLATSSSAVISPLRMLILAALAVLCAPASAGPIWPDVMLLRKSDDRAFAIFWVLPSASASAPSVPGTAGSPANGDCPLAASGVLTYVPNACPPTDWATPATANPAVSPTTSPRTARRFTQCIFMRFISHSFLRFLVLMSLDVAAPSRPVLHNVAARQVDQVRIPVMLAPPAHRIDMEPRRGTAALRPTTIIIADLQLRPLKRVLRVEARRHIARSRGSRREGHIGNTHHEARALATGIVEARGIHGPIVIGVHAVVDRHVPGDLERLTGERSGLKVVTVDLDLALGHDAIPCRLPVHHLFAEKNVEPEGELATHRRKPSRRVGEVLRVDGFIRSIPVRSRHGVGECGVDAPAARPLPGGALCLGRRDPEVRLRRHADLRLVATGCRQQPDREQTRPADEVSVFSHHVRSALLAVDDSRQS